MHNWSRRRRRDSPGAERLVVTDLTVAYSGAQVIQGISFEATTDQISAIVGENGAGKSTILRSITGFVRAETGRVTGGRIEFGGVDITHRGPRGTARNGLSLIPERDKVFTRLTVEENLKVANRGQASPSGFDYAASMFPALGDLRRKRAGHLSGGERQMLAVALALAAKPTMLLIDELSLGLAPAMTEYLFAVLKRIRAEQGIGFLVVEEKLSYAEAVADSIHIIRDGRLLGSRTCHQSDDGDPGDSAREEGQTVG